MTQEEKQLLLKGLCARVPYEVQCEYTSVQPGLEMYNEIGALTSIDVMHNNLYNFKIDNHIVGFSDFKPYLRPLSSMTEEEREYIKHRWCYNDWDIDGPSSLWREKIDVEDAEGIVDYFNEHHLDFRGLIPMGLALEAPEGMYKVK